MRRVPVESLPQFLLTHPSVSMSGMFLMVCVSVSEADVRALLGGDLFHGHETESSVSTQDMYTTQSLHGILTLGCRRAQVVLPGNPKFEPYAQLGACPIDLGYSCSCAPAGAGAASRTIARPSEEGHSLRCRHVASWNLPRCFEHVRC